MNLDGEQNYVDQYGKIWPLHAHIGKITSERALFNKFGFRYKQEHQKTLYFNCTKKKSDGGLCPFRGIYLKSNECLYIKGEHEHKHTKKAVEVEKIKIPKNIGEDYVDNYGKIWKFNKQIEKNAKYKMLYDIGFTNNWKRKSGIHLCCRKNGHNGECNFAGIYLNENGCLYTRGEHNHEHTKKSKNNGKKFGGTEVSKMVETDGNLGEIVVNNNNLDDSIPQQQLTVEILATENEQLNDEEQQIRNENYEELIQLKKCRQQFCIKLDDLRKNFIQQKVEFAKKEALMQRVIDQLTSEINKSNCRTLPENVSRMEMMEQQPIAERQEMIQENSIDSNSLTSNTFDENNCSQSNNSFRMMSTISPTMETTNSDLPCTSSSLNMDEPSTSAASFNHYQSPSTELEIVEECKNGPIGPPMIKREGRELQIGPTITIDEEDRPWMSPAFRRQSLGRVKKEEPAEDLNMEEANEREMDQPGPSTSTNGKNDEGRGVRGKQNDEAATESVRPRLLRERKQRMNYKD